MHDAIIIQIPALKGRRQTELLQLLAVFDQGNAEDDHHYLNLLEENIPEKYRPTLRRLQKAVAEKKVRDTMSAEDQILEDFEMMERRIAEKDEVIVEQGKTLKEAKKEIEGLKKLLDK